MFAIEVAEEMLVRALAAFAGLGAVLLVFGRVSMVPLRQTRLGADSAERAGLSLGGSAATVEQSLDWLHVVLPPSLPNLLHPAISWLLGETLSTAYFSAGVHVQLIRGAQYIM